MKENRYKVARDLVLDSIADDYEDFRIILDEVTHWGSKRGVQLTRDEVEAALRDVLAAGHAQAYELSSLPPHSTRVVFSPERLRELYFYITPSGLQVIKDIKPLDLAPE